MPTGVYVNGPGRGTRVQVAEIETLPGWDIREKVPGTTTFDFYRCSGKQDWKGRWLYEYQGRFTVKKETTPDEEC